MEIKIIVKKKITAGAEKRRNYTVCTTGIVKVDPDSEILMFIWSPMLTRSLGIQQNLLLNYHLNCGLSLTKRRVSALLLRYFS
jgi:hypothetical protein